MTYTGEYIGPREDLRGHRAILNDPRSGGGGLKDERGGPRHCPSGFLFAQFTSVPSELGDAACLKSGGPRPEDGDLRFGWHLFKQRHFKIDPPETD